MDTSDIYIIMCQKAKEIQLSHSLYEAGDIYYEGRDAVNNQPKFSMAHENFEGKERTISNLKIWLPRQDQLQEMIGNYTKQSTILYKFLLPEVIFDSVSNHSQGIKSMGILWLKIIMEEKYSKIWNGADWIKK